MTPIAGECDPGNRRPEMKPLLALTLLALSGCTISQMRSTLDATEAKCRTYLVEHPDSVDRMATACRKLLG